MTTTTSPSPSAVARRRFDHPVVDGDAHYLEYRPLVAEYLREEGATAAANRLAGGGSPRSASQNGDGLKAPGSWYDLSASDRQRWRVARPPFFNLPTKLTLDSATSYLPRLLQSRVEEIGLDFVILYPTGAAGLASLPDESERRAACRGFNRYLADIYGPYSEVMTPAAVIPMVTPEEAIEELEFAVKTLGLKVVVLPGQVSRPVPAIAEAHPELAGTVTYLDKLGLDSEYDYDPVWRKCVELKVSPTFHSGSQNWDSRNSPSNYMYNHIGHFAASGEALCKALFFGGVTNRFPELSFAFLECGVGWGVNVFADLVGHWYKRNKDAVLNYDPSAIDLPYFDELVHQYADPKVLRKADELGVDSFLHTDRRQTEDPSHIDEWAAAGIERAEDIRDRFIPNFFFGCEADDPVSASAFNEKVNPFGAHLNAIFSTDIGHWDVPDMRAVLSEAYELVERGAMTEPDFHDFAFANPVKLHTRLNKNFFDGTAIESSVKKLVSDSEGK